MDNSNNKKKEPKYYPPIHLFPIYGLLVCGFITIIAGVYLQVNNIEVRGDDTTENFGINGPTSIGFGIAILIYPIYILIKQYREKKRFDKNTF